MHVKRIISTLQNKQLLRHIVTLDRAGSKIIWQKSDFLNFSSNDYLNLTQNNQLKKGATNAIKKYGTGSNSSPLISGHLKIHAKAEQILADFTGYESALIFGSGFLTNLGVMTALINRHDHIFCDKLNHASLVDGTRLSGAKCHRFKHADFHDLERLLYKYKNTTAEKFIITDSVFSMDGDLAPIEKISLLAKKYKAFLIVDEAHAIGVFGKNGAGYCNHVNIKPDLITANFSKALGSYGGFALSSLAIRQLLINRARSFIYSTSLAPSCVGAAIAAIELVKEKQYLGDKLLQNAKYFYNLLAKSDLKLLPFSSQIIPIIIGSNKKTLRAAKLLLADGIYLTAIRPPSVPINSSRLRLSITLAHSKKDLKYLCNKISLCLKNLKII